MKIVKKSGNISIRFIYFFVLILTTFFINEADFMHCWKIINVERDFGTTRIILLSIILFILSFSFCYVSLSLNRTIPYTDAYFGYFTVALLSIYPLHKFFHYLLLIDYSKHMKLKIKRKFSVFPFIHLKLNRHVPKYRYISSLLAPFILFNALLLYLASLMPAYTHYISFLFGVNCLICLLDLLNVSGMIRAPHSAIIEETPKGYEVLVPLDTKK